MVMSNARPPKKISFNQAKGELYEQLQKIVDYSNKTRLSQQDKSLLMSVVSKTASMITYIEQELFHADENQSLQPYYIDILSATTRLIKDPLSQKNRDDYADYINQYTDRHSNTAGRIFKGIMCSVLAAVIAAASTLFMMLCVGLAGPASITLGVSACIVGAIGVYELAKNAYHFFRSVPKAPNNQMSELHSIAEDLEADSKQAQPNHAEVCKALKNC